MTTSIKRSRSVQRDVSYGQPPPKKQAVEVVSQLRTPARRSQHVVDTSKVVPPKRGLVRTRPAVGGPPAFADIGQQVRKSTVLRPQAEIAEQQTEDVRAWQKHYRKAFPSYVFFFENIPQDVLLKAQKQILSLEAVRIIAEYC
jgi:regulatory subunit for Cdc7p protein kinase